MILPLLLALQNPLAARADTVPIRHDAIHYDIAVALSDTGRKVAAEVTTRWRLTATAPVVVALDTPFTVVGVWVSDSSDRRFHRVRWERKSGLVVIPVSGHAGDSASTRVRYAGVPRDGLIIRHPADGSLTAFADNWPDRAHRWFPSQDVPADKATASFRVEAPAGYEVVANGRLERVDTLANRRTVWHYRLSHPVSPYNLVFGLAKFAITPVGGVGCRISCVPVSVWTFPADSAWAMSVPFRRVGQILDFLQDEIGVFPYAKLAHVESSTRFGGMENASSIFYNDSAYPSHRMSEETVAHESAHQWFGDAVTEADWHHLWLSEGFATYFAALWVAHADGDSAGQADLDRAAQAVFKSSATKRPIVDTAARDLIGLLNTNNYQKGAWVLHSLRRLIGDSAFFVGIRRYYSRFRDGTALSSDFAQVMNEAAGTDLGWYFRQALLQPGYPKLEVRAAYDSAGRRLTLTIREVQPAEWGVYRLPGLKVDIDGQFTRRDVTGPETVVTIEGVARTPAKIVVDPDHDWLLQSEVVR